MKNTAHNDQIRQEIAERAFDFLYVGTEWMSPCMDMVGTGESQPVWFSHSRMKPISIAIGAQI